MESGDVGVVSPRLVISSKCPLCLYMECEVLNVIEDNSKILSLKTGRLKLMFIKMENLGRAGWLWLCGLHPRTQAEGAGIFLVLEQREERAQ